MSYIIEGIEYKVGTHSPLWENPITMVDIMDFSKIKKLNLRDMGITEIRNLEHFTQLRELNLSFNKISDMKFLKNLNLSHPC